MRKFCLLMICAFLAVAVVLCPAASFARAYAAEPTPSSTYEASIDAELKAFLQYGEAQKTRLNRTPGSPAERESANYIAECLSSLTTFAPVSDPSTVRGIETFEFTSLEDGLTYKSQNVAFIKKSAAQNAKKVMLCAHYDSAAVYQDGEQVSIEGVNDNAASVALLLALAKELDEMSFAFDIELVFFGASSNDYAGSKFYMKKVTDEMAKQILLLINLDKIAVGRYTYIYVNEFETPQEKYFLSQLAAFNTKKLQGRNTLDFALESPNGLGYTHVGLESDHAVFMNKHINTLNFLSGDYESFITFGLSEFNDGNNVTHTQNDSLNYFEQHSVDYLTNLTLIYHGIDKLLTRPDFVSAMEQSNNASGFYAFWNNDKVAAFITAILFILFVFICYLIFLSLQKKSRQKMENGGEDDMSNVIGKIKRNIGDDPKD